MHLGICIYTLAADVKAILYCFVTDFQKHEAGTGDAR